MNTFLGIITFYAGSQCRIRNLKATVARLNEVWPDLDICLVEQNGNTEIEGVKFHDVVNISDTRFNKTKLLNFAVYHHYDYTHYVMIDADSWIDGGVVDNVINHCDDAPLVFPYKTCVYLNEAETRIKCRNSSINLNLSYNKSIPITRQTGLINVFSRKAFDSVHGFDEEFAGWGAEDDAFLFKLRRVNNSKEVRCDSGVVLHLWHEKANTDKYIASQNYKKNRGMCSLIRLMNDDEFNLYIQGKNTLTELYDKYKNEGKVENWYKIYLNHDTGMLLNIDASIYFLKSENPTLYDTLKEILYEDGVDYVKYFITTYIKPVKMSEDVEACLTKFMSENGIEL